MCRFPLGRGPALAGYRRCAGCAGLTLTPYPSRQPNIVFEGPAGVARQQALEAGRQEYFRRHLARIAKARRGAPGPGRLMEVGCGSGVLLRTATDQGWQADALELSPELAALARQSNPSAKMVVADVLAQTGGAAAYDAVIALDVLEHVLDPALMLRNCAAQLKPGGLLLLQTPNTRGLRARVQGTAWAMRDPDQHLNLFSPRGLRELLTATGLAVVSLHTVSGSGLEIGWRRTLVTIQQWLLDRARLGNALLVIARRADPS